LITEERQQRGKREEVEKAMMNKEGARSRGFEHSLSLSSTVYAMAFWA
jgi:hypothetical protein